MTTLNTINIISNSVGNITLDVKDSDGAKCSITFSKGENVLTEDLYDLFTSNSFFNAFIKNGVFEYDTKNSSQNKEIKLDETLDEKYKDVLIDSNGDDLTYISDDGGIVFEDYFNKLIKNKYSIEHFLALAEEYDVKLHANYKIDAMYKELKRKLEYKFNY